MTQLASEELQVSMQSIEDARIEAEPRIGQQNAREIAIGQLRLLLSEQEERLEIRPYGHGHAWNIWAVTVAIEQMRRSKGAMRYCSDALVSNRDADRPAH